jgi:tetratricopeptide (TPR) repeat protein
MTIAGLFCPALYNQGSPGKTSIDFMGDNMLTRHQVLRFTSAIAVFLLISGNAWSASPEEADSYYSAEKWAESAAAYEAILKENRNDARALYRLAVSLRHLGELDKADKWLKKAEKAGVPFQYIQVEQAHIKLLSGNTSAAIAALDAAEIAGLADPSMLTEDKGFEALASDVRFKAVVERVRKNQAPCEYAASFREFDFWIGAGH